MFLLGDVAAGLVQVSIQFLTFLRGHFAIGPGGLCLGLNFRFLPLEAKHFATSQLAGLDPVGDASFLMFQAMVYDPSGFAGLGNMAIGWPRRSVVVGLVEFRARALSFPWRDMAVSRRLVLFLLIGSLVFFVVVACFGAVCSRWRAMLTSVLLRFLVLVAPRVGARAVRAMMPGRRAGVQPNGEAAKDRGGECGLS